MILNFIFSIETYKIREFVSFDMAKRISQKENSDLPSKLSKKKFNVYFRYFKGNIFEQPYIWNLLKSLKSQID